MRPSWDVTWLAVAHVIASRSRCDGAKVGAVIVAPNQRIVATGYNGPPAGLEAVGTCKLWCLRADLKPEEKTQSYSDCYSVHAEMNALMYADRRLYEGGTLYITRAPCWDCGKAIANSGILRVMYVAGDGDAHMQPEATVDFMLNCGIEVDEIRMGEVRQ